MLRLACLLPLILVACTNNAAPDSPAQSAARSPSAAPPSIQSISPQEFGKLRQQHPGAVVLDVRTPEEFAANHIPGAINMDVNAPDFDQKAAALDKTKPHVVYCRTGRRSMTAAQKITANKVPTYHLTGGLTAWQKANLPTTQP